MFKKFAHALGYAGDAHFVVVSLGGSFLLTAAFGGIAWIALEIPVFFKVLAVVGTALIAVGLAPLILRPAYGRFARPALLMVQPHLRYFNEERVEAVVLVHHRREHGGPKATVHNALPEIVIAQEPGERLFRHKGWDVPTALDFTTRQEEHAIIVAAKKPITGGGWVGVRGTLDGGVPSVLYGSDAFRVEITLRADNIKPHKRVFILCDPDDGADITFKAAD